MPLSTGLALPQSQFFPVEVGHHPWALLQSAQTEERMSLGLLAGGEAKGGEDLRAWIPPVRAGAVTCDNAPRHRLKCTS